LPGEGQVAIPNPRSAKDCHDDMLRSWDHGEMTSADAFYHLYWHFTRDQEYFEAHLRGSGHR
jgi:hypothetical protein